MEIYQFTKIKKTKIGVNLHFYRNANIKFVKIDTFMVNSEKSVMVSW